VKDRSKIIEFEKTLDPGAASAIALALETIAPVLIIDERKGRAIAQSLNIPVAGTLKVLLFAKQNGIIKSVKPIIELLQIHSFRFKKSLVDEILSLANEI